jgi:hypothetical protein
VEENFYCQCINSGDIGEDSISGDRIHGRFENIEETSKEGAEERLRGKQTTPQACEEKVKRVALKRPSRAVQIPSACARGQLVAVEGVQRVRYPCRHCGEMQPSAREGNCKQIPYAQWKTALHARLAATYAREVQDKWVVQCQHCKTAFKDIFSKRVRTCGCKRRRLAEGLPLGRFLLARHPLSA